MLGQLIINGTQMTPMKCHRPLIFLPTYKIDILGAHNSRYTLLFGFHKIRALRIVL